MPTTGPPATPRILVVDDSKIERNCIVTILRKAGLGEIDEAENGSTALAMVAEQRYDLFLLDLLMPDMEGTELTARLRALPSHSRTPIIIVTAADDTDTCWTSLDAGADDFVTKPFNTRALLARVRVQLDRHQALQALAISESLYRGLYESMHEGVAFVDMEGHVLDSNPAFRALLGYTPKELAGMTIRDITPVAWHEIEERVHGRQVRERGYSDEYEKEYIRRDGEVIPVTVRIWATRDVDGRVNGMWGLVRDITERKRLEEQLRYDATHDLLTGLYNRRHLLERLDQEVSRAHRHGLDLTVCLCDLDGFKAVNDEKGHRCGDEALKLFASFLKEGSRISDICGRYGGDEFVLILPETSVDDAAICVDRIRSRMEKAALPCAGEDGPRITCSFGLTDSRISEMDPKAMLHDADMSLYTAKAAGRNRIGIGEEILEIDPEAADAPPSV